MAKYQDGCYDTETGVALIAKVLAGRGTMNYIRAALGKGTIPEEQTPRTMTEPAEYVMDAKITAITVPVDGECQVTIQVNSADVSEGFYCTGIMLYAQDPDEGEVPYTYMVLENEPEWIRPSSAIVGKLATFDIIAAVGAVEKVTATIDPEAMVSAAQVRQMIEEHNEDLTAHDAARHVIASRPRSEDAPSYEAAAIAALNAVPVAAVPTASTKTTRKAKKVSSTKTK